MSFDMREVQALAVDLGHLPRKAVAPLGVVVTESATRVRDDLRAKVEAIDKHGHLKRFPDAITFDVRGLDAEIGPDKNRRQGALGNLLYYGTSRHGPVLEHPAAALARESDHLSASAAAAVVSVLRGL